MYFIDIHGNIRVVPKQCLFNKKMYFEFIKRKKYGIK